MIQLSQKPTWLYKGLRHHHSTAALTALSFAESTVLSIPTISLLIPLCMARPTHARQLAIFATVASALGNVYGYALGHLGYQWVDTQYSEWVTGSWLAAILSRLDHWGILMVLLAALLPLPFRFVAIGAGASGMGIMPFIITATIGRGIQFMLIAQVTARLSLTISSHYSPSKDHVNTS